MSSAPDPAVLNFPSGVDSYSTKVDRFAVISGESHTIPNYPYQFYLGHLPLQGGLMSIPGYSGVSGTPASFEYNIVYSGNNAGLATFNAAQALSGVSITYTSAGDILQSEFINSLQTSVENIEGYVLTNAASSGVVHTSGDTMTGNLTMNGGSILTAVSGGNNVGLSSLPFASIFADGFYGQQLQSDSENYLRFDGNGLKQKAETIRLEGGTDIYLTTSGSTIYLYATTVSVSGDVIPTFSGFYDLGSPSKHWGTLYVDNIVTPNGSGTFVHTSGDSMTGNLTMNGASLVTDQIDSNTGTITINGNPVNVVSTSSINLTPAAFDQVNLGTALGVSNTAIAASAPVIPTAPSTYDLGASGASFRTLYVDEIIGATLSGSFVRTSGDTMTGDLTLQPPAALNVATINSVFGSGISVNAPQININANSDIMFTVALNNKLEIGTGQIYHSTSIIPTLSGTYDIGEPSRPLASVFADNLVAKFVSGSTMVNPIFSGIIGLGSGVSLIPFSSGTSDLGSTTSYFGTIYANTIITSATSGVYVSKFGDTMTGNLTLASGASILSALSGISNLGSVSNPFDTVFANNFTTPSGGNIYVLKTGDTMSGPLVLNDIMTPSGNMLLSGTNNLNVLAGTLIDLVAEEITATSTAGPIILDGNTEIQLLENGNPVISVNPSGAVLYSALLPTSSGTINIGSPSLPFDTIYANNLVGVTISGDFVNRTGDTMTGSLTMASGANILTGQSGTNNIGSPSSYFDTLYVNNLVGPSIGVSGSFVHVSGDTMTGKLSLLNAPLEVTSSSNTLTGGELLAVGYANTLSGASNVAIGVANGVSGNYNLMVGVANAILGASAVANLLVGSSLLLADGSQNNIYGGTGNLLGGNANMVGGINNIVSGNYNAVFGQQNQIIDSTNTSLVAGNINKVTTAYSIAVGQNNIISGSASYSAVFGQSNSASGNPFTLIAGGNNNVTGVYSLTVGQQNGNYGNFAVVGGQSNIAKSSATATVIFGTNNVVDGLANGVFGNTNIVSGAMSLVGGAFNDVAASVSYAIVGGNSNRISGTSAVAFGNTNIAAGTQSVAIGTTNEARGMSSFAIGTSAIANNSGTFVLTDSRSVQYSGNNSNAMYLRFENGITLASGSSLLTQPSGINNLGSPSGTFNSIYVDNVFADSINISGNSVIVSGTSLGIGQPLFAGKTGNNLLFNTISGNGNITVNLSGNTIVVSGSGSNVDYAGVYVRVSGDMMTGTLLMSGNSSDIHFSGTTAGRSNVIRFTTPSGVFSGHQSESYIFHDIDGETSPYGLYISGNTSINLRSNPGGIYLTATSGSIALSSDIITVVGSGVTPTVSGNGTIGSPNKPFSGVVANFVTANQYSTPLTSGVGGNVSVNWNQGTSQILNFTGIASGTYVIGLSNGIPGSAYVLKTIQNTSGTASISWSGTQVAWQGGVSGTMTAVSGTSDLFSFWYDGTKYLGSYSNNYY